MPPTEAVVQRCCPVHGRVLLERDDGTLLCTDGSGHEVPGEHADLVRFTRAQRVGEPERPTIGRVVWYRSKTGGYTVPAVVTATLATLDQAHVDEGAVPGLSSVTHVHLVCLTPGYPIVGPNRHAAPLDAIGKRELPPTAAPSFNLAGTYQEWDVPFFDPRGLPVSCAPRPGEGEVEQRAGTWTWPVRA